MPEADSEIASRARVRVWASVVRNNDVLFLDAEHEVVRVALHKARVDSPATLRQLAALLVRLMLLEVEGPAEANVNDGLLCYALGKEA